MREFAHERQKSRTQAGHKTKAPQLRGFCFDAGFLPT
jgi:hypothetical protein